MTSILTEGGIYNSLANGRPSPTFFIILSSFFYHFFPPLSIPPFPPFISLFFFAFRNSKTKIWFICSLCFFRREWGSKIADLEDGRKMQQPWKGLYILLILWIFTSKIAENETICFDIYGNFFFHLIVRRLKFTIYISSTYVSCFCGNISSRVMQLLQYKAFATSSNCLFNNIYP